MTPCRTRIPVLVAGLVVAVPLAACGASGDTATVSAERTPHGHVGGAEETAEAQPRLVVADNRTGAVRVLDLSTEHTTGVGRVDGGVDRIDTDGRFAYLSAGSTVHVVDSGSWTVDHGDHVHHYRIEATAVGRLTNGPVVGVHSDSVVTAVASAHGDTTLLDRPALEEHTLTAQDSVPGGVAVPLGERVLVATGRGDIEVRTRGGERVSVIDGSCPDPRGTAVTRRGVVFGCADGALLVSEEGARFSGEKIAYPHPIPPEQRAREFHHRPGSTILTAKAGQRGVWLLDVTAGAWRLFETGPVSAVNAVGGHGPVLTLTRDGVLHALNAETGEETADTSLLAEPLRAGQQTPPPVIQLDTDRAYVNDAAARVVYEIDHTDTLRLARTLTLGITPTHMVETGR